MSITTNSTDDTWQHMRNLPLSPRIERLTARVMHRYAELGQRIYTEVADVQARNAAFIDAYQETVGLPPILRRARALTAFAERMPVTIQSDDLLVGNQTFNQYISPGCEGYDKLQQLGYAQTTGHIVHDYAGILAKGISGLNAEITEARQVAETHKAQINLTAFAEALAAFHRFIVRHAEEAERSALPLAADLRAITEHAPRTFKQAVQLIWFSQIFLHAENPSSAISFGRLDCCLWPFLRDDFAAGRTTLEEAFEIVCALFLKCCEGEESQNAILGGVDADGHDASNQLSLLFLAVMRCLQTFQPSLSVRIHPASAPDFLTAACELAAAGTGNPGFMNDPVIIAALEAVAIPPERAWDWGVVGCYEATTQGDTYPNTVLGQFHLVHNIADYIASERAQAATTFDDFLAGWYDYAEMSYQSDVLPQIQQRWKDLREHAPSPFGSLLMRGCVAHALPLEAGGTRFNLVGINMLGLGSVVDSLQAIHTIVFDQHRLTLAEIAEQLSQNFPDDDIRRLLRCVPGRYGTDTDATNQLAEQISHQLSHLVLASRMEGGVRPYPAFFAFSSDIYAVDIASPDGRRRGELISYGVSASTTTSTTPTSLLASASHVAHALAACGCPLALTLTRKDVAGEQGIDLIRHLVQTYFGLGGSHIHINVASADTLRAAQADPAQHAGLTVRVSGYSARFITVDRQWQDAIITRAEGALPQRM